MKCSICNDEERLVKGMCKKCYIKKYDEKYREKYMKKRSKIEACKIIKKHHEDMEDDPERLTTEFIQNVVGLKCNN